MAIKEGLAGWLNSLVLGFKGTVLSEPVHASKPVNGKRSVKSNTLIRPK